ncbi:MAG: LacI family transcriptional regulator [Actinobacteria bacterium]|nr:LacI family transcriptional regulator [Actinomycetota bacterium]MCG2797034.1 LacI family transcriptional regulator [Cellulomonas sp.]
MTEKRNRQATRTDVARLAGTSVAVVSYVINDGPRNVSPERRRRVLEAMRELSYQPNAIARSLTSTRTNTVGMIVPDISNAFFAELALAVEDAAMEAGLLLFVGNSNENRAREEAYVDSFVRQRVDGVIYIGVTREASAQTLVDAGLPVVVLDRPLESVEAMCVGIDHRDAARQATAHLIGHGHTRIACVTGPAGLTVSQARSRGWHDALDEAGIAVDESLVLHAPFSLDGGAAAFAELARLDAGVTAAFVGADEQARGLVSAAGTAGTTVPDALAVTSIDGTRQSEFGNPPLTTMRQPFRELAVAAIAGIVTPAEGSPGAVTMQAQLTVGRSCGCAPAG